MIAPRRLFWPLALALALPAAPATAQFGVLNDVIGKAKSAKKIGDGLHKINEPEEIKIGGDLAGMLLGAAPLVNDPAKQQYVNRVGRWLALHSARPGLPWKFCIIDSDDFNAFSTPGGYVLITRGLFNQMRNEAELAGVLAHEIAHVERKHHLVALQKALRNQSFSEMQRYFTVSTGNGFADQFTDALLSAGKDLYAKGLDKDAEYEADRIGVVIAARSGYSPYGLAGVLQTLSVTTEDRAYGLHTRTHPLPLDRLAQLDTAMGLRFENMPDLVENTAAFVAIRNPAPPPAPAPATPRPVRKRRP